MGSMVWIGIGIVAGLALTVAAFLASRDRDPITGEQLFQLGVIFSGAGVALFTTIGVSGAALFVLGLVYMGIGLTRRDSRRL